MHAAVLYAEWQEAAMRILVTRPLEDGKEIAARLKERGHQALLAPLLEPHFQDGPELALADIQAILLTSANGVRALARRTRRRDLPIFAVGPQTAEEARRGGFRMVRNADGDAEALAEATTRWATKADVLLHVCGEDAPGTLADDLSARGFQVRRCALYAIQPAQRLPPEAETALRARSLDGALFFSPRSARIFGALADGLPAENLIAFCISPATAAALSPSAFAQIAVAEKPNQNALLDLLDRG
jgi:uroporphyrinogen-III synthase